MKIVRLEPDQRRAWILSEAVLMANTRGLIRTTLTAVADHNKFALSTVRYYFNRNADLWRAIVVHPSAHAAVREEGKKIGLQ